jgi:hypothetical protein
MAVSPLQLNAAFLREVDEFEIKIDSYLASKSLRAVGDIVSVHSPTGMTDIHIRILRERYKKAGWVDINYRSEQREGQWIEFQS